MTSTMRALGPNLLLMVSTFDVQDAMTKMMLKADVNLASVHRASDAAAALMGGNGGMRKD